MTTEKESKTDLSPFPYVLTGIGCLTGGWIIFNLAWPTGLNDIHNKARSAAATNTLATMVKECAAKIANMGSGTVIVPELQGYKPKKKNIAGFYLENNRKLSGTSIICPTTGEIKLVSENERKYPLSLITSKQVRKLVHITDRRKNYVVVVLEEMGNGER